MYNCICNPFSRNFFLQPSFWSIITAHKKKYRQVNIPVFPFNKRWGNKNDHQWVVLVSFSWICFMSSAEVKAFKVLLQNSFLMLTKYFIMINGKFFDWNNDPSCKTANDMNQMKVIISKFNLQINSIYVMKVCLWGFHLIKK